MPSTARQLADPGEHRVRNQALRAGGKRTQDPEPMKTVTVPAHVHLFGCGGSFENKETKDINNSKLLKEKFCFVFPQQTNYEFTVSISHHKF